MIVVKIEEWPNGRARYASSLGKIIIQEKDDGFLPLSDHEATLSHSGIYYGKINKPWRRVAVRRHNNAESVYNLLYKVLKNAVENE